MVATYEYDAYGNLLKETGNVENPYRYAGYRYDGETGLYYLQSRYYNPETGRFLTRDTFEGFENEPLSLNKYAYTENNPINFKNPNGYWKKTIYISEGIMYIILAFAGSAAVVLAAAGGWWVLAAALTTYLSLYAGFFWIGKKGTKITFIVRYEQDG